MTNEIVSIRQNEEYILFLEELKAIITEKMYNSRIELVELKWLLGKRVSEEKERYERIYGERIVETIARDLGMSAVNLWKCVQFYKKFEFNEFNEVLSHLPEGKAISWWFIQQNILPQSDEEIAREETRQERQENCSHQTFKCIQCHKRWSREEIVEFLRELSSL